jgi:hypothetical protein
MIRPKFSDELRKKLEEITQETMMFEQNDKISRALWVANVKTVIQDFINLGKIDSRRYDFYVWSDETNNPPDLIDRGEFVGQLRISDVKSTESLIWTIKVLGHGGEPSLKALWWDFLNKKYGIRKNHDQLI